MKEFYSRHKKKIIVILVVTVLAACCLIVWNHLSGKTNHKYGDYRDHMTEEQIEGLNEEVKFWDNF